MFFKKSLLLTLLCVVLASLSLAKEVKIDKFAVYKEPRELVDGHFPYANPDAKKGGFVVLYGYENFDTLNPFSVFGVAPKDISRLLYLPLFTLSSDSDSTVYGVLVKEFSIKGNKVKIYLREEAVWQNGEPITANDVDFTVKTLASNSGSYYRAVFSTIENIEIIDDKTFIITFQEGNIKKTLASLADLPILPEFFWKNVDFKTDLIVAPVGSGLYFLESYEFGKYTIFERVKNHWAEDLPVLKGYYNFDRIKYEYIRDKSVVRESFKAGILDIVFEYSAKHWANYWQSGKIESEEIIKYAFSNSRIAPYQSFVFNLRKEKFQDIRVRKAIYEMFDFYWLNKALLHGQYKKLESLFQDSIYQAKGKPEGGELEILNKYKPYLREEVFTKDLKAKKESEKTLQERLEIADKLLKEAGYIVVNNKRVHKDTGKQLEFEILVISKNIARLTTPFVRQLSMLGIKASIRVVNISNYIHMLNKYDYDMVIKAWYSSAHPSAEHYSYWSSTTVNKEGGRNLSGINNKAVDGIVNGLISSTTEEDLVAHARALDRVLRLEYINIPQVYSDSDRVLWYDKFGIPNKTPDYGVDIFLWWVK